MEEAMEQLEDRNHIDHHLHVVNSPNEIEKEEAEKQYQLLTLACSSIREDITQRKVTYHILELSKCFFSFPSIYCFKMKTHIPLSFSISKLVNRQMNIKST